MTYIGADNREACAHGHPMAENSYISPNGKRKCRQCNIENARRWRGSRQPVLPPKSQIDASIDPRRVRAAAAAYPPLDKQKREYV